MLLLWKWRWKCHKYIGKPAADHMHHFLLRQIFELDNLGLRLNLEKYGKFSAKIGEEKMGENIMI